MLLPAGVPYTPTHPHAPLTPLPRLLSLAPPLSQPTTGYAVAVTSHGFQRIAATAALLAVLAPTSDTTFVRSAPSTAPRAARRGLRNRDNGDGGGDSSSLSRKASVDERDQKKEEKEEEREEAEGEEVTVDVAGTNQIDEGAETDAAKVDVEGIVKEEDEGEAEGEEEGPAQKAIPKIAKHSGKSSPVRKERKRRQIVHHGGKQGDGLYGRREEEKGASGGGGRETGPTKVSEQDSGGAGAGRSVGGSAGAAAAGMLSELRATEAVGGEGPEQRASAEEECRVTGPCHKCEKDELDLEYCKDTQRRQEVRTGRGCFLFCSFFTP